MTREEEAIILKALFEIGSLPVQERFDRYGKLLYLDAWEHLPVKNHLPPEIGARFKTEKQWRSLGFFLNKYARAVYMHQSAMAKNTIPYYHESEVNPRVPFGEAEREKYERRQ